MGKQNPVAGDAARRAAEIDQMRGVIRDLHQAAMDARNARRDLKQAMSEWNQAYAEVREDLIRRFENAWEAFTADLKELADRQLTAINEDVQHYVEGCQARIQGYFAEALKARSPEELCDLIADQVFARMADEIRENRAGLINVVTKDMLPLMKDRGIVIDVT